MANILVIDDDRDILRLVEFALNRAGHDVIIAADGQQGLAELEARKPDLIVADVMMPNMTGYDFCRQVRALSGAINIPIIVFSARFQPVDKQTALQAGATDYLPKSISPDALVKRIEELLPAAPAAVDHQSIGFFSLRGGAGVTSLAVNTAIALAITQKAKTAMIDLAPLGGHAALLLGLRPTSSVREVLSKNQDLTLEAISPHFIEHQAGIHLLASPLRFEERFAAHSNSLDQLDTVLRPAYRFTIFDLPCSALEPQTASFFQQLDAVAVVISPDVPALQSTALALQSLARLGVVDEKIRLVVNQVVPQNGLPVETIQKAVKRLVSAKIPFEADMIKAVNSGKPLLLSSPKSAGAAAIARLIDILLN
jgi:pilus assembly protein CpaE